MAKIWLRTNARLPISAAIVALAVALVSGLAALAAVPLGLGTFSRGLAWGVTATAAAACMIALACVRRPRLAYNAGELLVFMRPGSAIRLPIKLVECFLLGRAPSFLPRPGHAETETTTIVVRLRPQAEEWSHVEVEPRLGTWCDSNIVIRGTWCEPINIELVHQLNRRLAAAQQPTAPSKDL